MKQMTNGAAHDFQAATQMAQNMVSRWGMSDELGPRVYGEDQSEVFLGRDMTANKNISDATAQTVDAEITRIITEQYARARKILEQNREKVEVMAKSLMEWETLDADQINDIMEGRPPKPPADSDIPPAGPESGTPEREQGSAPLTPDAGIDDAAGDTV